jgi:hypothetical protein
MNYIYTEKPVYYSISENIMDIKYEKNSGVDENCLFHYQEFRQKHFTSPLHLHDEFDIEWIVKSLVSFMSGTG